MERTTIILDRPILNRIRAQAHKEKKTLRETLREIILKGLNQPSLKKIRPLALPSFRMGKELIDISNRARLYELWDKEDHKVRKG